MMKKQLLIIFFFLFISCENKNEVPKYVEKVNYIISKQWVHCEDTYCNYLSFTEDSIFFESSYEGDWKSDYSIEEEKLYCDEGIFHLKYNNDEMFVMVDDNTGAITLWKLRN